MATFSDMKYALDEISRKNARGRQLIEAAHTDLVRVQSDLGAMTAEYTAIIGEINQAAIDNPSDVAYQMAKSEKDKLVANFQSLKTYTDALIVAFDGVTE